MQSAGPFTFEWTNEEGYLLSTEEDLTNIQDPGLYIVHVTNAYMCTVSLSMEIYECSSDFGDFNQTITLACNGPGTGAYSLEIPEGFGAHPYYVFWTTPSDEIEEYIIEEGNFSVENLEAGEYCIEVLSESGCSTGQVCGILIEEIEEPEIIPAIYNWGAPDENEIEIEVNGNSGPYYYTWANEDNQIFAQGIGVGSQDGLSEGNYSISISDENGDCEYIVEMNVLSCLV